RSSRHARSERIPEAARAARAPGPSRSPPPRPKRGRTRARRASSGLGPAQIVELHLEQLPAGGLRRELLERLAIRRPRLRDAAHARVRVALELEVLRLESRRFFRRVRER